MNHLLFGSDETERIVGMAAHGNHQIRQWIRDENDVVSDTIHDVHPFIYTTPEGIEVMRRAVGPHAFKVKEMSGANEMNRLAVFPDMDIFRAARKDLYNDPVFSNSGKNEFFTYGDPVAAYLVQSGKTFFKGMNPQTVHRMQVDIETYRIDGFPDAKLDPITVIAISDNRGFEKVLFQTHTPDVGLGKKAPEFAECMDNETQMLRELVKIIQRRDPDILEGHNFFAYDMPYITERCEQLGVNFAIGRDSKVPYSYAAEKKFAERDIKYTNFIAGGRSIIDTMFLAIDWDVYTRKLENVTLKGVAKTLGVSPENRTYIEGADLAQTWLDDPSRVLDYALDDVLETRGISDQLCSSQFALTQMMPLPYQKVHLSGKASVIQSLFIREYLRERASIPTSKPGSQEWGGYTDIFKTGVYDKVWYIDVASLYPSIMLNYDIKPAQDHLGLFQGILQSLTDLRFQTKGAMKKTSNKTRLAELDARQQAFKIIINSFYGMLGAGGIALFATVSEADRVARTGQGLLRRMMELIDSSGAEIIECDTDGVLCTAPPDKDFFKDGPDFCQWVTDRMPEGIIADFDGAYLKMLSRAKKNYALVDLNGKITIKGGSFKSRSLELLFRDYITLQLGSLLDRDSVALRNRHIDFQKMIMSPIEPAQIARTVTLKESFDVYDDKVAEGGNRAPQYEIGKALVRGEGRRVQKGDRISYVICGTKLISKVKSYVDATALEFVRPGTHHTKFYLQKLRKIAEGRFGMFFAEEDVDKVFPRTPPSNTIDMFGGVEFNGVEINNQIVQQYEPI